MFHKDWIESMRAELVPNHNDNPKSKDVRNQPDDIIPSLGISRHGAFHLMESEIFFPGPMTEIRPDDTFEKFKKRAIGRMRKFGEKFPSDNIMQSACAQVSMPYMPKMPFDRQLESTHLTTEFSKDWMERNDIGIGKYLLYH